MNFSLNFETQKKSQEILLKFEIKDRTYTYVFKHLVQLSLQFENGLSVDILLILLTEKG